MSKVTRKTKVVRDDVQEVLMARSTGRCVSDESKVPGQLKSICPQELQSMIAEAAYYRAQSHAFQSNPEQDWFEAEAEINQLLK